MSGPASVITENILRFSQAIGITTRYAEDSSGGRSHLTVRIQPPGLPNHDLAGFASTRIPSPPGFSKRSLMLYTSTKIPHRHFVSVDSPRRARRPPERFSDALRHIVTNTVLSLRSIRRCPKRSPDFLSGFISAASKTRNPHHTYTSTAPMSIF